MERLKHQHRQQDEHREARDARDEFSQRGFEVVPVHSRTVLAASPCVEASLPRGRYRYLCVVAQRQQHGLRPAVGPDLNEAQVPVQASSEVLRLNAQTQRG